MLLTLLKRLLPILAIALLALLSWWLLHIVELLPPATQSKMRHDPDYYMEDFVVTEMGENGKPHYQLKADYLAHYPDNDSTMLTQPHISVFQEDVAPWNINAEKGQISSGGKTVFLLGEVTIERKRTLENSGIKLITQDLLVRPDDKYAETEKPVTVREDNIGLIKAVGMRLNMLTEQLELLADVRGYYETR